MTKKFHNYAKQDIKRSNKIEKELVEFVNSKGGFIDTRNLNGEKDNIYGILYNEGNEQYEEIKISAVAIFDNSLCILPESEMECDIEDATKEIMLEDTNWHSVLGGMCWINATLIAICDCIEQYV